MKTATMTGRVWVMVAMATAALAADPASHAAQVAEGRAQYELVVREGGRPRYGACWTSALAEVTEGCRHLDDEMQSRLALGLANCFLERAGQRTYPCPPSSTIAACLEEVDSNAFTAYSNFFTHTQNMCYFLQSQVWQEEQEATMHGLADNSARVSESLAEASLLQRRLVERQEESLDFHRELASGIAGAKGNVLDMLQEFKISTYEQKNLIFQVFDKVSILQNLVVSEMSWLYTVIFYSACLLVIYLATATRRTADARLWLFVVLTANFAVERLVVKWSLPQAGEADVMNLSTLVHDRVWLCRQIAIAIAAIVLAVVAVRFKDYNRINNQLLEEIRRQNLELKQNMESFQVSGRSRAGRDALDGAASESSMASLTSHLHQLLAEDTGFVGDEEDFSEDEEDSFNLSSLSQATDVSFRPGSRETSFDDDDFGTARTSRETTPVNEEIDSALEALSSCLVTSSVSLASTPLKAVARVGREAAVASTPLKAVARVGREAAVASPSRMEVTPPQALPRYNLRRTPGRSSNSSRVDNSIVQQVRVSVVVVAMMTVAQESPEVFAAVVKRQLAVTKRNSAKWSQAMKRGQKDGFSSDEA